MRDTIGFFATFFLPQNHTLFCHGNIKVSSPSGDFCYTYVLGLKEQTNGIALANKLLQWQRVVIGLVQAPADNPIKQLTKKQIINVKCVIY